MRTRAIGQILQISGHNGLLYAELLTKLVAARHAI